MNNQMKSIIEQYITDYVREYMKRRDVATVWGEPLTGFASAQHPLIRGLREKVRESHLLPEDIMEDAGIVVSYYVPFTEKTALTNINTGRKAEESTWELASPEWARAYEETNAMFKELNAAIIDLLETHGYKGIVPAAAGKFDRKALVSDWSQRSIAYAAGLGTFGINKMLISRKGCCGRYGSVVTNLDVIPDKPVCEEGDRTKEYCLYKRNGTCGICIENCPAGALKKADGDKSGAIDYDRQRCYELCLENAARYTEYGSSYQDTDEEAYCAGSEVCGKCITGSPCAFWNIGE